MKQKSRVWTNKSVRLLAGEADPVEAILKRARETVLGAMDLGWSGLPFDPIALSGFLGIRLSPRADIRDARIVPQGECDLCIEYNPTRPRDRLRYSVAHEIAHTLFPDCRERVRNRSAYHDLKGDEWQLEMLCNIAAAEFLMPIGSFQFTDLTELSIDQVLALRKRFQVSTEAILIRTVHLADVSCSAFVASKLERPMGPGAGQYRIEYSIPSRSWARRVESGTSFSVDSLLRECSAIGYTSKGDESLPVSGENVHIECVGIPPYPGSYSPRVAGLITGPSASAEVPQITFLKGNALEPRGEEQKIVLHVVNDATPNWGGKGFAVGLKHKWPGAQREFRNWAEADRSHLKLGQIHVSRVSGDVSIASLVSQKGYGPSPRTRVRYSALEKCLASVADVARRSGAAIHMPRIACGQGGGAWFIVEELISSTLLKSKIPVFVYDLPENASVSRGQPALAQFEF